MIINYKVKFSHVFFFLLSVFFIVLGTMLLIENGEADEIAASIIIIVSGLFLLVVFGMILFAGLSKKEGIIISESSITINRLLKPISLQFVDIVNIQMRNAAKTGSKFIYISYLNEHQDGKVLQLGNNYNYKIKEIYNILVDYISKVNPEDEYGSEYKNILKKQQEKADSNLVYSLLIIYLFLMGFIIYAIVLSMEINPMIIGSLIIYLIATVLLIPVRVLQIKKKITKKQTRIYYTILGIIAVLAMIYGVVIFAF